MQNVKKNIIICKGCGRKIPFNIRLKPAIKELLDKKNIKETWLWIFVIALITQFISQIISDVVLKYAYN